MSRLTLSKDFDKLEYIGISGFPREWMTEDKKLEIAMDAALITAQNNGVPAYLTNYTHPEVIAVLTAKRAAEEIFDPLRTGTYGDDTATFPVIEYTGDAAPYSDYNTEGATGYNTNWPKREAYYFQTYSEWGDKEMAVMGKAKIDAASQKQAAAATKMKIMHNRIWFYGVAGLQNYGILNDPGLNASIAPTVGTAGNTWDKKTTRERYADIIALYRQLVKQLGGLVDMSSKLKLSVSNVSAAYLADATDFNVSVFDMIKKAFPNMEIKTAPELTTDAGELVMLHAPVVEQATGNLGYVELMRVHGVIRRESSFREKNSGANLGAVIRNPAGVATMLGV